MDGTNDGFASSSSSVSDVNFGNASQSGDLSPAIKMCMGTGNWSEALILAAAASPEVHARVQKQYFEVCGPKSSTDIVRVIAARDWKFLVEHCSVTDWEYVLTTVLTVVSDETELENLVGTLAERLTNTDNIDDFKNAVVCYLCIQNTNKVFECRAKMRHFDDVALLLEVSRAVGILKKISGSRGCNQTEFQSTICSSRVFMPAQQTAFSYPNGFYCAQPVQMGNSVSSSIPPWNVAWNPVIQSPGAYPYSYQVPQLAPRVPLENDNGNHSANLGFPLSSGASSSSPVFLPPTGMPPPPYSNVSFGGPPQFVHRPPVVLHNQPTRFTNSNRVWRSYFEPPAFQHFPAPHQFKPSPVDFQGKTRPKSPQSPSTNKTSGFLSKLKSPIANPDHKFAMDVSKIDGPSNPDDSLTSVMGSPVSSDTMLLSSFAKSVSTPEQSLDSELLQDSENEVLEDRNHELLQFLEHLKDKYCSIGENSGYPIRDGVVGMLVARIDYWNKKFQSCDSVIAM